MMQGNVGVGAAEHKDWARDERAAPRRGDPSATPSPTGERSRRHFRHFRHIRLHRQFAPILIAITLLSTLGLTGLAYVGARSYAISGAEAQALQDIQVERRLVLPPGDSLRLQDGRLVVSGLATGPAATAAPLILNDDTTLVDLTRSLTGDDATIYQAEGSRIVAVSTNLPAADARGVPMPGSRALGDVLTGSALDTLQGACASSSSSAASCHQTFQGTISVRGLPYAAALVPLYDANGAYVGALGVAEPLASVTAPAVQLAVMLLIAALLLALLALVTGFWLFGSIADRALGTLDLRLRLVADAASEVERLAQLQTARAGRQEQVARQASEQARALDAMAEVMEQGRASLRDASGDIWGEMSQPGLLPDPALAVRLAQQAAVAAAQVGSAAEDARDVCHQLVGLMNHVIAEGAIVEDGGTEMESRARDLRAAVESVEMTVGERLLRRSLFLRRVRAASQRVRHFLPAPFGLDHRALSGEGDDDPDAPPTKVTEPHPMANWSWPTPDLESEPEPEPEPARERPVAFEPPLPPTPAPTHAQPAASGQYPTPRSLRAQQQQAPRTPPRLIRTGELPPVLPSQRPGSGILGERPGSGYLGLHPGSGYLGERPGSGHLGVRPGSGLLSGHNAEPSLTRGPRPAPEPPGEDWNPSASKHSGWLG